MSSVIANPVCTEKIDSFLSPANNGTVASPSLTIGSKDGSPSKAVLEETPTFGLMSLNSRSNNNKDTMDDASRMQSLARQLEFYFSKQNLFTDTYLQTLRGLNDGCVPVSILANFSKVKAILTPAGYERKPAALLLQEEEVRVHAILQAVSEYTELLRICSIDTTTGKITTDETPSSAITILAVGLATNELPSIPSVQSLASLEEACSNTIILRDVTPSIKEEEIKGVLDQIEDCPPVDCIARDVANCWFVTFRSRDRTALVRVMMQLRSMTFPSTGEHILSRLKTSMTEIAVDVYNTYPCELTPLPSSNDKKKSKKKKKRGSKNRNKKRSATSNGKQVTVQMPSLPSFSEDQFPSLHNDKVEWETSALDSNRHLDDVVPDEDDNSAANGSKYDEECEPKSSKALSDAASTATTTSSSLTSSSEKQMVVIPAYAAAVMKGITSKPSVPPSVQETSCSNTSSSSSEPESKETRSPSPVLVDSQWGGGRSFVDVVRPEQSSR